MAVLRRVRRPSAQVDTGEDVQGLVGDRVGSRRVVQAVKAERRLQGDLRDVSPEVGRVQDPAALSELGLDGVRDRAAVEARFAVRGDQSEGAGQR